MAYENVDLDTIKFTLEMPPGSNQKFQYTLTTPISLTGIHNVRPGDTLSNISRKYYGSSNQWRKILNANRQRINDPDRIATGTTLTIP
ncbi:MAG: LysM peptidoglycan-binding domain-containing protein [Planctomycetota bacterium]|jgi:nucleoid-associated protein YgaU